MIPVLESHHVTCLHSPTPHWKTGPPTPPPPNAREPHHPSATPPCSHSSRKLLNHLFEHKQWPSHLKPKIKNYLYNFRAASSPYDMGLSSIGTLHACTAEHHIDERLAKPDDNLLTTGIISFYFDAETKEMVLKMTMYAVEEMLDGYSVGRLMLDWTYKITKEKIPVMTMGICDIQQHGRLVCFGPTRFETANTVRLATMGFKSFVDKVANVLVSGVDEPSWNPAVCAELREKYDFLVDDLKKLSVDDDGGGGVPQLDTQGEPELQIRSRSLPLAPPAPPPVDPAVATLESILVPAMEKVGDSPREARHKATRTRASSAPPPPLAPPMRVGDDVEVAGSENSSKVHLNPTSTPNPNQLQPPRKQTITLTLTLIRLRTGRGSRS